MARRLRTSLNSAYVWRRRWRAGGKAALTSEGPGGAVCRLSAAQLAQLRAALEGGPAARPQLIDGFLAQTGLTLEPRPP